MMSMHDQYRMESGPHVSPPPNLYVAYHHGYLRYQRQPQKPRHQVTNLHSTLYPSAHNLPPTPLPVKLQESPLFNPSHPPDPPYPSQLRKRNSNSLPPSSISIFDPLESAGGIT